MYIGKNILKYAHKESTGRYSPMHAPITVKNILNQENIYLSSLVSPFIFHTVILSSKYPTVCSQKLLFHVTLPLNLACFCYGIILEKITTYVEELYFQT
jgi:hypothetical protein